MIRYEDEFDIINGENNEVLIPFLITETKDGTVIEAYSGVKNEVEYLINRKKINCFSKEGIDEIDRALLPYVRRLGYEREICGKYKWYLEYRIDQSSEINVSLIVDGIEKLKRSHLKLRNLTTFNLKELLDNRLAAYAVIRDGAIVSLAAENQHARGQNVIEITVETAPAHRRAGYASSVCAALCRDITARGKKVAYACSRYNRGSISTAKKTGFVYFGRFYAYTAYIAL